jgi:AcrR family transcriptional regulator
LDALRLTAAAFIRLLAERGNSFSSLRKPSCSSIAIFIFVEWYGTDGCMSDISRRSSPRMSARDRILTGALRAMSRTGVRKVSIDDMCREAGVSKRTLYRHFDGKQEILTALVQHVYERLEREFKEAIAAKPALEDRVWVVGDFLIGYSTRNKESMRLTLTEPEFVRGMLQQTYAQYLEMIRCALAPLFEDQPKTRVPQLRDVDLAEMVWCLATQAVMLPKLARPQLAEVLATLLKLARRGAVAK